MSNYQEFDFEQAAKQHTSETVAFLKANFNTKMSEDDFVKGYQALPHKHKRPGQHLHNENVARKQYRRLQAKFGFFTGELA